VDGSPDQRCDFGYDEEGDGEGGRVVLEDVQATFVVSVVGIEVRIERTCIDESGYRPHSSRRISSMRF
jgi:hypothetical protein